MRLAPKYTPKATVTQVTALVPVWDHTYCGAGETSHAGKS
jgi:hypothetical protein